MSLFFYLFAFAVKMWHQKFVTADVTVAFVNNQHGTQRRGHDFDKKKLYLKEYTTKRLTDKFPQKSWTKRGVHKLLKKLRVTGTVDRQPGSSRPPSACTEQNVQTVNGLVFKSRGQATDPQDCPWDITGDGYSSVHSKCNLFAFSSISAENLNF